MPLVNIVRFATPYILSSLLLMPGTVFAEMGKGTVQDPITRAYTDGIYKDWLQGVMLHPETGHFIVTYKDSSGFFNEIIFEPATKIEPILKSKFRIKNDSDVISYFFKLKSGPTSKQPISGMWTIASIEAPTLTTVPAPNGWLGSLSLVAPGSGSRLGWRYRQLGVKLGGLGTGKDVEGFGVETTVLPGISVMKIRGAASTTTWLGEAPDVETTVGAQVNQLQRNDFVPRLAAVPRIPNPAPFNTTVVLGGIQKHVKDDMASMQLIDPALLGLIDRGLTQAMAAAQGGNTPSLLHEIKSLRQLLKQEHADVDQDNDGDDDDKEKQPKPRIAKLAAKVLDFDLKYVEKRVKGDKD